MRNHLPKKISPCPINEAILEIRYETSAPGDAVFGLLYSVFREDFPNLKKLPVLQIPENIRANDPNLMHLPEYRLSSDQFILLIGPRTLALAVAGEYCGWQAFNSKLTEVIQKVRGLGFVEAVSRVGLRYINVFEFDIFSASTLQLSHNNKPLESTGTQITAEIPRGDLKHTLRVASGTVVEKNSEIVGNSVIDIDTSRTNDISLFLENYQEIVDEAHDEEKELFFSLLTEEYLEALNPEY